MSALLHEIVPRERPRVGRRDLMVGAVGGLLGLVLGATLAVVTIILPWRAEVRRRMQPTPFVRFYSPLPTLRQLGGPGVTWTAPDPGSLQLDPRSRRLHFVAQNLDTKVQAKLMSDFHAQAATASIAGQTYYQVTSGSTASQGPDFLSSHFWSQYRANNADVRADFWWIGHGRNLELYVAIEER